MTQYYHILLSIYILRRYKFKNTEKEKEDSSREAEKASAMNLILEPPISSKN